MRYGSVELPPAERWRREDYARLAAYLAFVFVPWLVVAAVVLAVLLVVGVWQP